MKIVTEPVEYTADSTIVDELLQNGGLDLNVLTFWDDEIRQRAGARVNSRNSCLELRVPYFILKRLCTVYVRSFKFGI